MESIVHLFQLLSADEAILVSIEDLESLPNCVCIVVLQQMQGISAKDASPWLFPKKKLKEENY